MNKTILLRKKTKYGYMTMTLTPEQFEKNRDKYIFKGSHWHIVNQAAD